MSSTTLILLLWACSASDLEPGPAIIDTWTRAEAIGEQGTSLWEPETLYFDWTQTVWAFGVHRMHAASGNTSWRDYYQAWMDAALPDFSGADPESFHSSDSMSPTVLAATLMGEVPSLDYSAITDAADAYLAEAPRLANGAIAHWGYDNPYEFETDQVWIDSQFMFGVYLARMYAQSGQQAYLDEYLAQYQAFSDLCRDPQTQLYHHAWDESQGVNIPAGQVYWARGNAWVLVSAAELLNEVEAGSQAYNAVQPLFQQQAEATLALQEEDDGLWHTVLNQPQGDDPDNYTETSASALIAYAFLRGLEAGALVGDEWVRSVQDAAAGVMERIEQESDGHWSLEGTSFGTNPGETYEDYVGVEQVDDLMLGYGAALMLLAEAHGVERVEN